MGRSINPDSTNSDVQARTWLKPEQIARMKDACLTSAFPTYLQERNLSIVTLLEDTGLRAGECVALDVDHLGLDGESGTIYLPSEIQKGSPPPATLELADETRRQLRRYIRDRWKDSPALFPSRSSDRMTTRSLRRLVKRIATEADISPQLADGGTGDPADVTPHTLRHSVAYRIIQVDDRRLEDVQLRLRHANRSTTDQIYSHLVPR